MIPLATAHPMRRYFKRCANSFEKVILVFEIKYIGIKGNVMII